MKRSLILLLLAFGVYSAQGQIVSGSQVQARQSLTVAGKKITGISDDTSRLQRSSSKLVTEKAMKDYADSSKKPFDLGYLLVPMGDTGVKVDSAALDALIAAGGAYWAANGTHIYKTNSGNVGIGTNNPSQALHVTGGVIADSVTTGVVKVSGTDVFVNVEAPGNNKFSFPINLNGRGSSGNAQSGRIQYQGNGGSTGGALVLTNYNGSVNFAPSNNLLWIAASSPEIYTQTGGPLFTNNSTSAGFPLANYQNQTSNDLFRIVNSWTNVGQTSVFRVAGNGRTTITSTDSAGLVISAPLSNTQLATDSQLVKGANGQVKVRPISSGGSGITPAQLTDSFNIRFASCITDSLKIGSDWFYTKKITIDSSGINNGNTVAIEAISEPGIGKAIDLISATYYYNYGATPYSSESELYLYMEEDAGQNIGSSPNFTLFTYNIGGKFDISPSYSFRENIPIYLKFSSDNSDGDGTVVVYIYYRIVTI